MRLRSCFAIVLGLLSHAELSAQGFSRDNGNCLSPTGLITVACWNPLAGSDMPPDFSRYSDPLPNLQGWDYRINMPHVRFQVSDLGVGGPTSIVGVVEDTTPFRLNEDGVLASGPVFDDETGHRNNAIWLFRIKDNSRFVQYKVLPSRRVAGKPENAASLNNDWYPVGPLEGPRWTPRPVAALVTGKGFGAARIHLFLRGDDGTILHNTRLVAGPDGSSWPDTWQATGATVPTAVVFTVAFGDRIAMAWQDTTAHVRVRLFDPAAGTWGAELATPLAAETAPQLLWDGVALNIFAQQAGRLRHSAATRADLADLTPPALVAGDVRVPPSQYHAASFNGRIHVAFNQGPAPVRAVMYTTSLTPRGAPSQWAAPSDTRLRTRRPPRIGSVYENLLVVATDAQGIVRYSRKDPNAAGNDLTGRSDADSWLQAGQPVDAAQPQPLDMLELLPFNSDLYLTANGTSGWIVNLSRSVFRNLMTSKWGVQLAWGEIGGAGGLLLDAGRFATGDETPAVGYFDGDRKLDYVIFHRARVAGEGWAPVYVIKGSGSSSAPRELWHPFFSLPGEIPAVGDFNGDGLSDIVTFTQQTQRYSDGSIIGPAVVWVATSDGTRFRQSRIWHRSFAVRTERPLVGDFDGDGADDIVSFGSFPEPHTSHLITRVARSNRTSFGPSEVWQIDLVAPWQTPLVGDFDGDGKADIVVFSKQPETGGDGHPIGPSPVWVSLSDGTRFGTPSVWQRDFAPGTERVAVADVNLDGKDDIVSFVSERPGSPAGPRAVVVAFSDGTSFSRPVVWASDLVSAADRPFIGNLSGNNLGQITNMSADTARHAVGVAVLRPDGSAKGAAGFFNVPYAVGAPWENYKWFTEKGIGVALYPEWIYANPGHCLQPGYVFGLLGSAGSGGSTVMHTSVRSGGRAGHIQEELGHGLAANCLRQNSDPFNIWQSIYTTPVAFGGLAANARPGCQEDPSFYSCRPDAAEEHYFLKLLGLYRMEGNRFRKFIASTSSPAVYTRRLGEYQWFKQHWFQGVEFKGGDAQPGGLAINGLQCLPGECAIPPGPPPPPDTPPTRAECLADCRKEYSACIAEGGLPSQCAQLRTQCQARCPRRGRGVTQP